MLTLDSIEVKLPFRIQLTPRTKRRVAMRYKMNDPRGKTTNNGKENMKADSRTRRKQCNVKQRRLDEDLVDISSKSPLFHGRNTPRIERKFLMKSPTSKTQRRTGSPVNGGGVSDPPIWDGVKETAMVSVVSRSRCGGVVSDVSRNKQVG